MSPRSLCTTFSLLTAAIAAQGLPTPMPQHQKLARFAGTWDAVIETAGPDGKPMQSRAVSAARMAFGGFWLVEDFTGDFGGVEFHGQGLLGFDPNKGMYVQSWVDSMSPTLMVSEGTFDAAGNTLAMTGIGPGMQGRPTKMRSTFAWHDDDHAVEEMRMSGPDGTELSKLTITYTRHLEDKKLPGLQRLVADTLQADYRGDLEALAHSRDALAAQVEEPKLGGSVRYWLGFALWRLALNRMNAPDYDHALALAELRDAATAFEAVNAEDLTADAKSAAAGCLMSVLYLLGPKTAEAPALLAKVQALLAAAVAAAPTNPRVLWVLGGKQLWTPAQFGGSRETAIATYERGLAAARTAAPAAGNPLAPAWGEPELLMTLAFAWSNFEPCDCARAETFARAALELQPEWHYVRDVLLPAILGKRARK